MSAGRPTDYCPEIVEKARAYLNGFEAEGDVVPTVAGLALSIGIRRSTVYEWIKHDDKAEFSDIVDAVLAKQERGLTQGGLRGDHNPTIAKLMLTKHGYADKQEQSGPEGGPMETVTRIEIVPVNPDGDDKT